jgi:hypothetical protein
LRIIPCQTQWSMLWLLSLIFLCLIERITQQNNQTTGGKCKSPKSISSNLNSIEIQLRFPVNLRPPACVRFISKYILHEFSSDDDEAK